MICAFALLLMDLFGLQVTRICDVTKDGVDELVVTDPIGDEERPRAGRVLIIDPKTWSLVREFVGNDDETRFGAFVSVSQFGTRIYAAVSSQVKDQHLARVRLIDLSNFEVLWSHDVELQRAFRGWAQPALCVADPEGASLLCFQPAPAEADIREHLVLWRHTATESSLVSAFDNQLAASSGQNMCAHYGSDKKFNGLFVACGSYFPPFTRGSSSGPSQLFWVDASGKTFSTIANEKDGELSTGQVFLLSDPKRGRFACDVVAVRRKSAGGQVALVTRADPVLRPIIPNGEGWYFGASMCWMRDVDADGIEDLAVGCPVALGGSVLVVGSKSGAIIRTVEPTVFEGLSPELHIHYASSFGTQVASIPDQDGDGKEDLVVAATTEGCSMAYPAALSVVSTKTWKIIRVVFERDLLKAKSEK